MSGVLREHIPTGLPGLGNQRTPSGKSDIKAKTEGSIGVCQAKRYWGGGGGVGGGTGRSVKSCPGKGSCMCKGPGQYISFERLFSVSFCLPAFTDLQTDVGVYVGV